MFRLLNSDEEKVLETLCTYPTREFSISGLARESDVSKGFVSNKAAEFEEENIITINKRGNQKVVKFNRDNEEALNLKQLVNLDNLYSSEVIEDLVELYSYPKAIILFGSFASGEDTENSDIDIAVITSESHDYENTVMERPISVTEFNEEIPSNMLETLANGITLYGHLEVNK